VRHRWRRFGSAILLTLAAAVLTALPAAGIDTYPAPPLEVRIFGAQGAVRDFIIVSAQDRRAAAALLDQVSGALGGPVQPIEDAAATFPHYQIGVSRLGPTYITDPWLRTSETRFIYYPGWQDTSFLVIQFSQHDAALEQRWILVAPDVASLLRRHLQGLPPIGLEPASPGVASEPADLPFGALLLTGFSLLLLEDGRRLSRQKRSAGKGT
jgi:hypothetical protein